MTEPIVEKNGKVVIIVWLALCLVLAVGFMILASTASKPVPLTPDQIRQRIPD